MTSHWIGCWPGTWIINHDVNTHTTVESGYNKHGYNEIPPIAKSFPGTEFFSVIFTIIKYGYNEFGYSEITLITKASFIY